MVCFAGIVVLVCCVVSIVVLLLGPAQLFYVFAGTCILFGATLQPYKVTSSPKNAKYIIFFIPLPSLTFFFRFFTSSGFFSCTCSCCNYTAIFAPILPELMPAYDTRFSIDIEPFSIYSYYFCFFTTYKFTIQSFWQCPGLLHLQQLPRNVVALSTIGSGFKLLDLLLINLAAVLISFLESIVDYKTFFYFCYIYICCSYSGVYMQDNVAILSQYAQNTSLHRSLHSYLATPMCSTNKPNSSQRLNWLQIPIHQYS